MDCVVCFSRYCSHSSCSTYPCLLACGHSYCVGCVSEIKARSGRAARCPECKRVLAEAPSPCYALLCVIGESDPDECEGKPLHTSVETFSLTPEWIEKAAPHLCDRCVSPVLEGDYLGEGFARGEVKKVDQSAFCAECMERLAEKGLSLCESSAEDASVPEAVAPDDEFVYRLNEHEIKALSRLNEHEIGVLSRSSDAYGGSSAVVDLTESESAFDSPRVEVKKKRKRKSVCAGAFGGRCRECRLRDKIEERDEYRGRHAAFPSPRCRFEDAPSEIIHSRRMWKVPRGLCRPSYCPQDDICRACFLCLEEWYAGNSAVILPPCEEEESWMLGEKKCYCPKIDPCSECREIIGRPETSLFHTSNVSGFPTTSLHSACLGSDPASRHPEASVSESFSSWNVSGCSPSYCKESLPCRTCSLKVLDLKLMLNLWHLADDREELLEEKMTLWEARAKELGYDGAILCCQLPRTAEAAASISPSSSPARRNDLSRFKCGACGEEGHKRNNKKCPLRPKPRFRTGIFF